MTPAATGSVGATVRGPLDRPAVPLVSLIALCATIPASAVLSACGSDEAHGSRIVIDGGFADWDSVPPVLADPFEEGIGAIDFGELRVESDDDAVYFAIDLARAVTTQAMFGTMQLVLDMDADATTGETVHGVAGADRVIAFSPARTDGRIGQGVATRTAGDTAWTDTYGIGLLVAPTYASRYKELRIERTGTGNQPSFAADTFRGRFVYHGANGELADETDIFEVPLRRPAGRAAGLADASSVERSAGTTFRILVWNVSDRGPVEAADAFHGILTALAPDVVMFDEVSPDIDATWFAEFFTRFPGDWTVVRGTAGGRQTSVVASRLGLGPVAELAKIAYPDSVFELLGQPSTPQLQRDLQTGREDGIPTVGAILEADGRRVLLLPVDLQCCGHATSAEERARNIVADAMRGAVRGAIDRGGVDAVIMAGDFNLVGSREPLDIAGRGIDPAGGDLEAAPALRLDGSSDHSWRAAGPFPPGRLDFALHSAALEVLNSFAFATEDLSADALTALGLEATFASAVSDHLPIVLDIRLR